MLLDEFDPSKTAVINPWDLIKEIDQIPKTAIACYSHITFERIVAELQAEIIAAQPQLWQALQSRMHTRSV